MGNQSKCDLEEANTESKVTLSSLVRAATLMSSSNATTPVSSNNDNTPVSNNDNITLSNENETVLVSNDNEGAPVSNDNEDIPLSNNETNVLSIENEAGPGLRVMDGKNIYFVESEQMGLDEKINLENEVEADLCIQLRDYLLKQGFKNDQVLIMSTTIEQSKLIQKKMKTCESSTNGGIVLTDQTVEIIIFSTVICSGNSSNIEMSGVAQSLEKQFVEALRHARTGFYVFGNKILNTLPLPLFGRFQQLVRHIGAIGPTFPINRKSAHHRENTQSLIFNSFKNGTTSSVESLLCLETRPCGHPCLKKKHFPDLNHGPADQCEYSCGRKCTAGHVCPGMCHTKCDPCQIMQTKTYPCGHTRPMECWLIPYQSECDIIVKVRPPCGHISTIACSKISTFICTHPCKKELPCDHICGKTCGEECEPCVGWVSHQYSGCWHFSQIMCGQLKYQRVCLKMVNSKKIMDNCGHNVRIPCFQERRLTGFTLSSIYCCFKNANRPCEWVTPSVEEGGCGHPCQGTAADCHFGNYHVPCSGPCGRTLICGHICRFGCTKECHVCVSKCVTYCEHGPCAGYDCGVPCPECEKPCKWKCKHLSCTNKCGEVCNRDPCNEPCTNVLGCGHLCVCFCGEPCSPLCRTCDKEILLSTGYFEGNDEILDSDRFIYLEKCGHTFEHSSFGKWMATESEDGEIRPKVCPLCREAVWTCRRFSNVLHTIRQEITTVKRRIYGSRVVNTMTLRGVLHRLRALELEPYSPSRTTMMKFKEVLLKGAEQYQRHGSLTKLQVNCIEFITKILIDAWGMIGRAQKHSPEFTVLVEDRLKQLFDMTLQKHRQYSIGLIFSPGERGDITRQIKRVDHLLELMDFIPNDAPGTVKNLFRIEYVRQIHENAFKILNAKSPYFPGDQETVERTFEVLRERLRTTINITEKERLQILGAFDNVQGRWFKCRKGHVYIITECGGATQTGVCPECRSTIGGISHRLSDDNELASEMDGAIAPHFDPTRYVLYP